jgi:hypothetical protein
MLHACRWQLLYTSRPGTASPIQRAFTGTEAFKIFQEVQLGADDDCRVSNVVEFGDDAKCGSSRLTSLPPLLQTSHRHARDFGVVA